MTTSFDLFEVFGIELEYMIVDRDSLNVLPICDQILAAVNDGSVDNEAVVPPLRWSNELVMHVIELKTDDPARAIMPMAAVFQKQVAQVNRLLEPHNGCLLPGAMHPWMHPDRETRLWPHGNREIYQAFNAIFDCRGHGWSNLQSAHLNLPFQGEEAFFALHSAIRLILPLLPALSAASPIMNGKVTGMLDSRLDVYRSNCRRIPSITAGVVPEAVYSISEYHDKILARIYRDISPLDEDGILQEEWLNARGAIARFERDTIEIRVLDVQECPLADHAIHEAIATVLRYLTDQCDPKALAAASQHALEHQLRETTVKAGGAILEESTLPGLLGLVETPGQTVGQFWQALLQHEALSSMDPAARPVIETLLREGTLAERLLKATGNQPDSTRLHTVWGQLAACLAEGRLFLP